MNLLMFIYNTLISEIRHNMFDLRDPIQSRDDDYHYQKTMAERLRKACIDKITQEPSSLIYQHFEDELPNLAQNFRYAPIEFISVLNSLYNLNVVCINVETQRYLTDEDNSGPWKFKLYYFPDTANGGRNAHFSVSSDKLSTFADGNCLFHAFAQFLKCKYFQEHRISCPYYEGLFADSYPKLKHEITSGHQKLNYFNWGFNGAFTTFLANIGLNLTGVLHLGLPWLVASSCLLLALGGVLKWLDLTNLNKLACLTTVSP